MNVKSYIMDGGALWFPQLGNFLTLVEFTKEQNHDYRIAITVCNAERGWETYLNSEKSGFTVPVIYIKLLINSY